MRNGQQVYGYIVATLARWGGQWLVWVPGKGRNWVLRRFQQLRSYHDEIETRNREEIPYSLRIVPRGLSVAERP